MPTSRPEGFFLIFLRAKEKQPTLGDRIQSENRRLLARMESFPSGTVSAAGRGSCGQLLRMRSFGRGYDVHDGVLKRFCGYPCRFAMGGRYRKYVAGWVSWFIGKCRFHILLVYENDVPAETSMQEANRATSLLVLAAPSRPNLEVTF